MSRYTSKHTGSEIDAAIDRAKVGGAIDMDMQNKVPLLEKHLNDTHAFTNIGWYWVNANADNMPMDMGGVDYNSISAIMFVRFSAGLYAEIDLWFPSWSSGFTPHFRQKYVYGTWEPWCWVDPQMYLGVEYRTTERYLGKPVYVKLVDCGASGGANTTKKISHNISNMKDVVDYGGSRNNSTGNAPESIPNGRASGLRTYVTISPSTIYIYTVDDNTSYTDTKVWIKYTKTTD